MFFGTSPRISSSGKIWLITGNGSGSTNTFIRRFTTTNENTSSDVTYADSATLGATFTILRTGLYNVLYTDYNIATSLGFGLTKNSTSPTLAITNAANDAFRIVYSQGIANNTRLMSFCFRAVATDVIRPHCDLVPTGTAAFGTTFIIQRIGF